MTKDTIKLLEELVVEAVDRLGVLARERDGLRDEVASLRAHIESLEAEASTETEDEDSPAARGSRAAELVKEALAELRA